MKPTLLLLCLLAGCERHAVKPLRETNSTGQFSTNFGYIMTNDIGWSQITNATVFAYISQIYKNPNIGLQVWDEPHLDYEHPTNIEMQCHYKPILCGVSNGFYIVRFTTNTVPQ